MDYFDPILSLRISYIILLPILGDLCLIASLPSWPPFYASCTFLSLSAPFQASDSSSPRLFPGIIIPWRWHSSTSRASPSRVSWQGKFYFTMFSCGALYYFQGGRLYFTIFSRIAVPYIISPSAKKMQAFLHWIYKSTSLRIGTFRILRFISLSWIFHTWKSSFCSNSRTSSIHHHVPINLSKKYFKSVDSVQLLSTRSELRAISKGIAQNDQLSNWWLEVRKSRAVCTDANFPSLRLGRAVVISTLEGLTKSRHLATWSCYQKDKKCRL